MRKSEREKEGDYIFGMLSPLLVTLDRKRKLDYQQYYCGMCRALGRNGGFWGKCTLSNDIVFAYLIIDGMLETACAEEKCRCIKRFGLDKKCLDREAFTDYLAAANIILFYEKLVDNIEDDHSLVCKVLKRLYENSYSKTKEKYPDMQIFIKDTMLQIRQLESQGEEYKTIADLFGRVTGYLFYTASFDRMDQTVLENLGVWLGRWIYVMDAWKDYYKDRRKEKFNPIRSTDKRLAPAICDELLNYLTECQIHMEEYMLLCGIHRNVDVLLNIIHESMTGQMGILWKREIRYGRQNRTAEKYTSIK